MVGSNVGHDLSARQQLNMELFFDLMAPLFWAVSVLAITLGPREVEALPCRR
jgi:hypothetical protein